jgi:2-keto-4-pentenoate hydratase/2-oxohepta-3-ene-1,7-dioic acid hydratase in catechol pathway
MARFASYTYRGRRTVGLVDSDRGTVFPIDGLLEGSDPIKSMLDLIKHYDPARTKMNVDGKRGLPLSQIILEAPIPRPFRNVMCVGKNYHEHALEFARSGFDGSTTPKDNAVPTAPIIFSKPPESVIGDGAAIRYPLGISDSVDYEAEVAVVIGKEGRRISRARALEYVWGYTIMNDVTARDWQARHKQWFLGKAFDTFCPMGPWIVTADEIDAGHLDVRCWVNEELRQVANTKNLIFDVPYLLETISAGITLYSGDVIATGTPAGVGIGFSPPKFLRPGDQVRIEIAEIGTLTNPVKLA